MHDDFTVTHIQSQEEGKGHRIGSCECCRNEPTQNLLGVSIIILRYDSPHGLTEPEVSVSAQGLFHVTLN